ncbi:response regulator transcription factor [Candidatus Peregrinibacteria bacterium]|nr:response regulator transcription factor [Candidatus Peregrinibacteria bacterium]
MQQTSKRILLIDDEKPIAETIQAYARKENMEIVYVFNGEAGLEKFSNDKFDLVLLDWMLPGISGPDIIKKIRETSDIPILMISARNEETDIVVGLELGADDYITKPFGPRELIARIYSLLRRTNKSPTEDSIVTVGDLKITFDQKEIIKAGKTIDLTPKEFRILELLASQKGKVVSREELMIKALGYNDFLNDRTLDTHIKNLRKKIEENPKTPQIIKTVRETGFKFSINNDV